MLCIGAFVLIILQFVMSRVNVCNVACMPQRRDKSYTGRVVITGSVGVNNLWLQFLRNVML